MPRGNNYSPDFFFFAPLLEKPPQPILHAYFIHSRRKSEENIFPDLQSVELFFIQFQSACKVSSLKQETTKFFSTFIININIQIGKKKLHSVNQNPILSH